MIKQQTRKRCFLIDGHAQIYRSYFAIGPLSAPDGTPTNAIYGFITTLCKLLRQEQVDYLAVVLDPEGPTCRHRMYRDYKANRKPMEENCARQVPILQKLLEEMQVPVLSKTGYEADDIMGTLAGKFSRHDGVDVILVSGDKDLKQLLNRHVSMLDMQKGTYYGIRELRREFGITPEQMVEVQGLAGDPSDNIPGVPGVGMKTAVALIREFHSIEGVLDNIHMVKGTKRKQNLSENRENAMLSRNLATLITDVPMKVTLDDLSVSRMKMAGAGASLQNLGFSGLLTQLAAEEGGKAGGDDYHLVNTPGKLDVFIRELGTQQRFAIDTETSSPLPRQARLVGLSFSWKPHQAYYLPVRGPGREGVLDEGSLLEALKPILENPRVGKIGQNIKYDYIVLKNHGIHMQGITFDTMIASYLLSAGRRRHGLDTLAVEVLGVRTMSFTDLVGKGKNQIPLEQVALEKTCAYACEDVDLTIRLAEHFQPKLRSACMEKLFLDVELPLASVLGDMEFAGIRLDCTILADMAVKLRDHLAALEREIHAQAGAHFNIASTKQLQKVLFEDLGLPVIRKTKTGASTDSEVLARLARRHPVPGLILAHRQAAKLLSTYIEALPRMVHPATGRIHASFHQTVTATGRLSASDPNLQNIPVREQIGREIRRAFTASSDAHSLISADYSQIELRILAHLSRDPGLLKSFADNADIHAQVASEIFDVPLQAVSGDMRRQAKAVNFGVIYGQSPFGLANELGISIAEATAFIDTYFARFAMVKDFIAGTLAFAREHQYVQTVLGRRRALPGIHAGNAREQSFAQRAAVNTVVQGSAADLIKLAMLRIARRHKQQDRGAAILLQIHDELIVEVPDDIVEMELQDLRDDMIHAMQLHVPLAVCMRHGKNWYALKD